MSVGKDSPGRRDSPEGAPAPAGGASPVFGWLNHPSLIDYPGHIAAVFFLSGCNFRCGFCHNAGLLGPARSGVSWFDLAAACRRFQGEWVDGAVVSGGEPTLAPELDRLLDLLLDSGFSIKLDTNGSRPDRLAGLLPRVAYVAMDVKTSLAHYADLCGGSDPGTIAASIALLRDQARDFELRTTVIEGVHTDEVMHAVGELIRGARRYVLQPFIPRPELPDERWRSISRTPPDRLEALKRLMSPYVQEVIVRGG